MGSNLGDREENLQSAVFLLEGPDTRVIRTSSVWETEPLEFREQPWFLNLVVEAETDLEPEALLRKIQSIEEQLGRQRLVSKGPRTIDIDILLFSILSMHTATLDIPHPGLPARRFVLEPLAELAPELRHPQLGRTVSELLSAAPPETVRRLKFRPVLRNAG